MIEVGLLPLETVMLYGSFIGQTLNRPVDHAENCYHVNAKRDARKQLAHAGRRFLSVQETVISAENV